MKKNQIELHGIYMVIPYIIIAISMLTIFMKELGVNGDEIWNYNFAKNICDGRVPYVDFNMVQTPLSAYIAAFFLKLFGNSLVVFRVCGYFLGVITFSFLYKICYRFSGNTIIPLSATIFSLLLNSMVWIYNYNNLILCLILTLILIELKQDEHKMLWCSILVGAIYGLLPWIKQSTGALLFLFNVAWCTAGLLKKRECKHYFFQLAASAFPSIVFVFYLIKKGITRDFVDYAVIGIKTFTHKISYFEYISLSVLDFIVGVFPFVVLGLLVGKFIYKKNKFSKIEIYILLISIIHSVVVFPICDTFHMVIAVIPYIVLLTAIFPDKKYSKNETTAVVLVVLAVVNEALIYSCYSLLGLHMSNLNHFELIPVSKNLEENIIKIDEYIIEKTECGESVVIADPSAALCMIPIDHYNKNFDMMLIGNIGTSSVEDLVKDHSIFLIPRDKDILYQSHFELISYIESNYEKIGEVIKFDVYCRE